MRIPFRALVLSGSLMLSTVVHADISALDSEHFLDPHEQETIAIIATNLARAGEIVTATLSVQEPEVIAAVETTLAPEPRIETSAVAEALPEVSATEVAAISEPDQVEATGSLPVVSTMQTEPTSSGEESEVVAMTSQSLVEPVSGTTETAEDAPAAPLP